MVRSKGLEPSRLLGTTTSRLRVYQFHHERIAGRGTWLKQGPIDKPILTGNRFLTKSILGSYRQISGYFVSGF